MLYFFNEAHNSPKTTSRSPHRTNKDNHKIQYSNSNRYIEYLHMYMYVSGGMHIRINGRQREREREYCGRKF